MERVESLQTTLFLGDCLEVLQTLPDNFISSVVCDPPAGIGFMQREWDSDKGGRESWIAWLTAIMCEVKRVLKPGGYILVWALPKTSHWTATAIENAGFEVRDVIHHLFSSGMPKNHDVGRALPEWAGWGTALKPAAEHWILARRPLEAPTVAQNVAAYGTGAIHVNVARVGSETRYNPPAANKGGGNSLNLSARGMPQDAEGRAAVGRWPANVVLTVDDQADDSPDKLIDRQSGYSKSVRSQRGKVRIFDKARYGVPESGWLGESTERGFNDEGGASRFFKRFIYCGKASPAERGTANNHPTVKGNTLMRYLILLVTPPGGIVLDPFMGSGSTGVACVDEGFSFVGIEQNEEYYTIACARIREAREEYYDG